jgi:predicted ATPase/DNA-binding CsgD family transcriptional regulator/transcriptional regulator with XRE-family HTH domain
MSTRGRPQFAGLLRRQRIAAALSQEALAEQAGLSGRGIADLERGVHRFPYLETLRRLADALELTGESRAAFIDAGTRPKSSDALEFNGRVSGGLPLPTTSFVGRDQHLAAVAALVSTTRLLTLTGPGGVGKTRLALALATATNPAYADGVWFVDLAPLTHGSLVVHSLAAALGIRERAGVPVVDVVCDAIDGNALLIVLDNCEHVLADCASLVEEILRQTVGVRLLVTSREALRCGGEVRWPVPSLGVPESDRACSAETLGTFGATRLFVERARAVAPRLEIDDRQARSIARICRHLDGLPLAIELAAARMSMFSVEQIADRMEQSVHLLSRGTRTAPLRQQTLRATFDWSYELLSDRDRLLLNRLTVFAGGWTIDAAEGIAGTDGIPRDEIVELLGGLVDKSLVVAEAAESGGAVRYRLLEMIRQYGREHLIDSGELESLRDKHAAYYLKLAEESEPHVLGPDRKARLSQLEIELDNFRAAREHFVGAGETEEALRLASALYRLWLYRGYAEEGRTSLLEALAMSGGSRPARAKALFCAGGLGVMVIQTEYASARRLLHESLALYRAIGDKHGIAWALMGTGAAAVLVGDMEEAATLLAEARLVSREFQAMAALGLSLAWSADLAYAQGDFVPARRFAEEAVEVSDAIGFVIPACIALPILGNLAWRDGQPEVARGLLESALNRAEGVEEAYPIVRASISLALLLADKGQTVRACGLLARSARLALETGNWHHVAQALEGLAAFAAQVQEPRSALQFAGAAASIRQRIGTGLSGTELDMLQRRLAPARRELGTEASARAAREAAEWTIEEAVRRGLEFAAGDRGSFGLTSPRAASLTLTRREHEVALLVARGLSNREVADTLVINEKTAKNHVQRVLEKVGVSSRRQIIARASELGLHSG